MIKCRIADGFDRGGNGIACSGFSLGIADQLRFILVEEYSVHSAEIRVAVRYMNGGQRRAVVNSPFLYRRDRRGNGDGCQRTAAVESTLPDRFQTVRKGDVRQ